MTNQHEKVAAKVVDAFKAGLSDAARAQIPDSQFDKLALMIEEAVAAEMAEAAMLVEEAARKLRAGAAKPELGL